ncbi:hypothetical protein HB762_28615 (plasmid) [Vibrio campbellii]|uniref:Uncharacterized protein n=1 Tax=Vibrio campbellii TaxID=680 RepID=A0ABY5ILR5_9VIBR|nr:hypothetical protein HB760_26050 [Vibrio campbellii]UTZ35223.1 hypothetical protein HB762_28210 [Vibrio campbellii]UTZ35228.1 hypothetical protein HB762_28615 [Vibrio campbellii]
MKGKWHYLYQTNNKRGQR